MPIRFCKTPIGQVRLQLPDGMHPEHALTLRHAAENFGFLVRRGEQLKPAELADRIRSTYGPSARRDDVLRVLKLVTPEPTASDSCDASEDPGEHGEIERMRA
ncbi:MAG: hypothetical protein K0Q43_91 [Ramlibacter sp.]|jgi:hypothetical protein|nr:hypothetical protein [Ramlibacter sp.]